MASEITIKRDPASVWAVNNPVLALGELGLEEDTGSRKVGDGAHPWNALPYDTGGQAMDQLLAGYLSKQEAAYTGGLSGTAPLRGRYAARPAATAVATGVVYYATDVPEGYLAVGTDGQLADSWWPLPSNGGRELAVARREVGFTVGSGATGASATIFGTQVGFVMPESPVQLAGRAVVQLAYADTDTDMQDPVLGIYEVTGGVPVLLDEAHPGVIPNPADFRHGWAVARVTGPPGQFRAFELRGLCRTVAWSIRGSATYPITLEAVTR